jgi:hypothetical protein
MSDKLPQQASPSVQYLTEDEMVQVEQLDQTQDIEVHDTEATLAALATPGTVLRIPRNKQFNRQQVVNAFQNAFELVGGVPRLAIWADANPTEFFKLYAKLMPKQEQIEQNSEIIIKHVLPRTSLDE